MLDLLSQTVGSESVVERAKHFLATLEDKVPYRLPHVIELPAFDPSSHCVTISGSEDALFLRAWIEQKQLFHRVDNHLGPAFITQNVELYFIEGKKIPYEELENHPRVIAARDMAVP